MKPKPSCLVRTVWNGRWDGPSLYNGSQELTSVLAWTYIDPQTDKTERKGERDTSGHFEMEMEVLSDPE